MSSTPIATATREGAQRDRADIPDNPPFLRSLTTRLALFAILLTSATATVIGRVSYTRARAALEVEARSRLSVLARDVADRVHREVDDRLADITSWSRLEVMRALLYHDVDKQLAQFLRQIVGERQVYRAIAGIGADGATVAAAGDEIPPFDATGAARPHVAVVGPGPGHPEPLLRLDTAVPHPDEPAAHAGTLVAIVAPARLLATVRASLSRGDTPVGLTVRTATGEVVLTTTAMPDAEAHEDRLRGSAAVAPWTHGDGPALDVVVEEPARVALAAVAALRTTLLRIGLVVLALSSLLGVLLAWRITEPVRRLTAAVRRVGARGRLEEPLVLPRAPGEIGVLAAAFRSMMDSLGVAQAEALVQSRRAFLGEIAANVAHEVRTPLSVLKTSAQLLARTELPPAEQRRLATNIAAEVDRLNGVVTSLVELARPRPARRRREALAGIVDRAVEFFAPQATRLGVTIDRVAPTRALHVHGDADQLHQVLLNVIHNALQAMGGPGRLDLRWRDDGGSAVLEVTDSGPGLTPDALAKAFAPFCSTKPEGSGLGLAISKRIVEDHGGTIEIANRGDGGAVVRIRLPAVADPA